MVDSLLVIGGLSGGVILGLVLLWLLGKPVFSLPLLAAPRWTKKHLYVIAQQHNIKNRSKMSRDALLRKTRGLRPRYPPTKIPSRVQKLSVKPQIRPKRRPKQRGFHKGMDLHTWVVERNRHLKEIEKIKEPQKRIQAVNKLQKNADKYSQSSWMTPDNPYARVRRDAKREIQQHKIEVKQRARITTIKTEKDPEQILKFTDEEYKIWLNALSAKDREHYPHSHHAYMNNYYLYENPKKIKYRFMDTGLSAKEADYQVFLTGKEEWERQRYPKRVIEYEKNLRLYKDGRIARYRPKDKQPRASDMSTATPDKRIDAIVEGKAIRGATREERRIAHDIRKAGETGAKFGTGGFLSKRQSQITKLTAEERKLVKRGMTPIQARRFTERIQSAGADLQTIDLRSLDIESQEGMEGYMETLASDQWEAAFGGVYGPQKRFKILPAKFAPKVVFQNLGCGKGSIMAVVEDQGDYSQQLITKATYQVKEAEAENLGDGTIMVKGKTKGNQEFNHFVQTTDSLEGIKKKVRKTK
ncbi:hypothetical protein CEE45_01565 [Candidatus Heimdallarchaeota archaeon B3_Heim]|nr:MAG: hypothetical protein CEE45_01565 [Candidatus Heimdallarchaeota archaeon B3_Heim]